jgi:hypothetical protein
MKARVIPGASRGVEESAREGPRPTAREIPRWREVQQASRNNTSEVQKNTERQRKIYCKTSTV